jgi:hypothetical protein
MTPSLSVLVFSQAEAEESRLLYLDLIEDARILLDRGGVFEGCLQAFQKRLQVLGARKVPRQEVWYWDLKPDLVPGEVVTL